MLKIRWTDRVERDRTRERKFMVESCQDKGSRLSTYLIHWGGMMDGNSLYTIGIRESYFL